MPLCIIRQDNEIQEQIERDVLRTHPDMHFFSGETPEAEEHRTVRLLRARYSLYLRFAVSDAATLAKPSNGTCMVVLLGP